MTKELKEWIETLNESQLKEIVLETVTFCIDAEEVSFDNEEKYPYWSNTGERLDGLD